MKNNRIKNRCHNKKVNKGKIAAIAGLTLTAGMILSDVTPAIAATTEPANSGQTSAPDTTGTPEPEKPNGGSQPGSTNEGSGSSAGTEGSESSTGTDGSESSEGSGAGSSDVKPQDILDQGDGWVLNSLGELIFNKEMTLDRINLTTDNSIKGKVKKIIFNAKVTCPAQSANLFQGYDNLTSIENLSNLDTSNVTDFSFFFANDTSLKNVDLSKINTSSATNMMGMFSNCDISTWQGLNSLNTANVSSFVRMFDSTTMDNLDLSSFQFAKNALLNDFLTDAKFNNLTVSKNTPIEKLNIPKDGKKVWFEYNGTSDTSINKVYTADEFSKLTQDKIPFDKTFYKSDDAATALVKSKVTLLTTKDGKSAERLARTVSGYKTAKVEVLDLPHYDGFYLASKVTTHIDDSGNATTPVTANYLSTMGDKQITLKGDFGEKTVSLKGLKLNDQNEVTLELPNTINGYKKVNKTIQVKINDDGSTEKTIDVTANYEKLRTDLHAKVFLPGQKDPILVPVRPAIPGDTVTVTLPDCEGYVHEKESVLGTVNEDGTIDIGNSSDYYQKHQVTNGSIDLTLPDGSTKTITGINGDYNSTVEVDAKPIKGFDLDSNNNTAEIFIDENGELHFKKRPVYSLHTFEDDAEIPVTKDNKNFDLKIRTSVVYSKSTIIKLPTFRGYKLSQPNVEVFIGEDGKIAPKAGTNITYDKLSDSDDLPVKIKLGTKDSTLAIHATASGSEIVPVELPKIYQGYQSSQQYVYVRLGEDGKIQLVDPDKTVVYLPVSKPMPITFTPTGLNSKDPITVWENLTFGQKTTVFVPFKPGYESTDSNTVTVTLDESGNLKWVVGSPNISYTKKTFSSVSVKLNTNLDFDAFQTIHKKLTYNETTTVPLDSISGYKTSTTEITVKADENGHVTQISPSKIIYEREQVDPKKQVTITMPDKSIKVINNIKGDWGSTVTLDAPTFPGYDLDPNHSKVKVKISKTGEADLVDTPQYIGKTFKGFVNIPVKKEILNHEAVETTVFAPAEMQFKSKDAVSIELPKIDGYTPSVQSVAITVDQDGNFKAEPKDPIIYKLNKNTAKELPIKARVNDDDKTLNLENVTVHYGELKLVDVPKLDGFTPNQQKVLVHLDDQGKVALADPNTPIIYTPTKGIMTEVTINIDKGDKDPEVHKESIPLRQTETAKVLAPEIPGYDPATPSISVTLDENGEISYPDGSNTIKYTPKTFKNKEVTLNTNLNFAVKQTISEITFNQPQTIKLNPVKGYSTKTKEIKVQVDAEGNVTQIDPQKIKFTRQWFPSFSGSSEGDNQTNGDHNHKKPSIINEIKNTVRNIIHRVTTLFHRHGHGIKLYNANFQVEGTRSLSAGSDWYSDQEVVHDGKTYYRVSKNEYVAAEDIYAYENKNVTVTIKADSNKSLVNSQGKISNRMLAKNTAWHSDRTIQINGKTYYRVSTDEFVSADDVIVK